MATLNPQQAIAPTALSTTAVKLYFVPNDTVTVTRRFTFANSTSDAHTFTVHIVPNGDSVDSENMFINAEPLGSKKTTAPPELEGLTLEVGDSIWAFADASDVVNIIGSVTEIA